MSKDYHDRSYNAWAEAFTIFAKYSSSKERGDVVCGHDIIYAGPDTSDSVSEEDIKRLEELGWHVDDDEDCFYTYV